MAWEASFVGEDYVIVSSYLCEDTECLPHKGPPQLNELSSTSISLPTQKDHRIPVHEVITNTRLCRPGSSKCMRAQVVTVTESSEINWLSVDYLCPETCKQYSWINPKYISSSEEGEYLSPGEHHCFFLLLWWISSFGCILGKHQSIFSSSYLDLINLHISKLLDLWGLFKTLVFCIIQCHYLHYILASGI